MNKQLHQPVLLNEVINNLMISPTGTYVDCTAGLGGHSAEIIKKLSNKGKLICLDQDQFSISELNKKFSTFKNIIISKTNFSNIDKILVGLNVGLVDGIVADLGVSSPMFDQDHRGFSYHNDARLDMRMDNELKISAWDIVNKYEFNDLMRIFKLFGEVKNPKRVVFAICKNRQEKEINTTCELVDIIKASVSKFDLYKAKHPARQYFQALRIAVNNELEVLKTFIIKALTLLKKHGILAIISYHSLEDRIVKNLFRQATTSNLPKEIPIKNEKFNFQLISSHPIIPRDDEILLNNRARSAKLRIIKKIQEMN